MDRVVRASALALNVAASLGGVGGTPVVAAPLIRPVLRRTFGPLRLLDAWEGESANYARVRAGPRTLFLKYRPALDFRERPYRRFRNEALYLREFAPHSGIPHAPLKHAAWNDRSRKAHLVLEDLAENTLGWWDLSERERFARVPQVMSLIARYHARWLGHPQLARHPSFPWRPPGQAERARRRLARTPPLALPPEVLATAAGLRDAPLEAWLDSGYPTLVHGDLHFQQVLFGREDAAQLYLIDYQHTRVAPLGADLAHLLAVRFTWFERRQLEGELLGVYRAALAEQGVSLGEAALWREYALGLLLNFVAMWERLSREPEPLFRDLVLRTHAALEEHLPRLAGG